MNNIIEDLNILNDAYEERGQEWQDIKNYFYAVAMEEVLKTDVSYEELEAFFQSLEAIPDEELYKAFLHEITQQNTSGIAN